MGINPGGIIVPGYLVLNLNNYPKIIYTILISLLTMLVIKFFSRYVIIYGRRKFALMILTAYFLNLLIVYSGIYNPNPGIIGYLVPGILANQLDRQGIISTLLAMTFAVILITMILLIFNMQVF
ncbi:poly-gamma-glutamate biosynthesis protein PgsC [Treponema phagedenis F0421]|nr:poly-gamma-glutamate biosynthesis protein PgsC [Treponema phagedenis F0421]